MAEQTNLDVTRSLTSKPISDNTVTEDGANERVQFKVDATGGTFTATYGGQTTSALAYNVSADNFEAALESLSSVPDGAVQVTGGPGNSGGTTPYVIEFVGDLANTNVGAVTGSAASLTGGGAAITITVLTAGSAGRIVARSLSTIVTDPEDELAVQIPDPDRNPTANATELDPLSVHDEDSPADVADAG